MTTDLEISRKHIQRYGKLLYKASVIARYTIIILIILQLGVTIAVFLNENAAKFVSIRLRDNFLFNAIKAIAGIETMSLKHQAGIGCGVLLLSYIALLSIANIFRKLMKYLADGERPFEMETARYIRKSSNYLLLLFLYNPISGILVFILVRLFSYIMEYGAVIQGRADETNRIQEEMIVSFAEITENKSWQTGQHVKRVSEYSRILATELGFSSEGSNLIRIASTMHDIGKLLIPAEILEKPGRLTDEEFEVIKQHTIYGGQLLENVEGEEMILSRTIALEHHERYDGKGYPVGITGEEISLEGRIVAVADVYDALTSKRSYKEPWKEEDAYNEIVKGRGTQFDPVVVDAFISAHDKIKNVQSLYSDSE